MTITRPRLTIDGLMAELIALARTLARLAG